MKMRNPYIGPRSFTRQEADRFFGREREARDLLSLVIAERLALFYAQSGAGKTSLLNTRLIPGLEANGRAVLPVARVSGDLPEGLEQVDNIFIFNLMQHLDQGAAKAANLARLDLSSFLRNLVSEDGKRYAYDPAGAEDLAEDEDAPVCVLIIDQFEEILTAHPGRWQDRAGFFRQLNQAMQDDPKLSVVLSLREDYVAALEPYSPLLADRMRARFYMERMGRQAALAAIAEPAAKAGRPFARGAAELLADNLSLVRSGRDKEAKPGQYIEPVQLQVVCWQLWQNLPEGEVITAADVQGAGNIDHALADFYEQAVAEAVRQTKVSQLELRQWFDRRLITEAGTRGTVFQGEESCGGMDNRAVRLLEDRFLLRAESRSGAVWYELVHDRFVEPIVQANRAWLAAQGPLLRDAQAWLDSGKVDRSLLYVGEKLEKTLAEVGGTKVLEPVVAEFLEGCKGRQAWLDEKAAANRRFRTWFKVAVAVAVVAVAASLWAGWATWKAKTAEQIAIISKEKKEEALARLQKTETLNTGMALNAKAEAAESKGNSLFAHLYSLYALTKLSPSNGPEYWQEAVLRAQTNTIQLPAVLIQHKDRVQGAAFSPDGRIVFSVSADKTIGIWDAVTGKRFKNIEWNSKDVSSIAFSADGRFFASSDKIINIWRVSTGKLIQTLEGHADIICRLSFSPDCRFLASCSRDKTVGIWDVSTGKQIQALKTPNSVYDVVFSPDSQFVASISMGNGIAIWNAQTGQLIRTITPAPDSTFCASFSPDGRILASGSYGEIDLWNTENGNHLKTFKDDGGTGSVRLSFSPDGRFLVSAYPYHKIVVWDIEKGERLKLLEGYFAPRHFAPDGQTLLAGGFLQNTIGLLEKPTERFRVLRGHADKVQGMWFSPDGRTFASSAKDKTVAIWDVNTGRRLQVISLQASERISGMSTMPFSPNGQLVASTSWNSNSINIWEAATGKKLRSLEGHTDKLQRIIFSPDGKLASNSWDNTIKIWDAQTGKCLQTLADAGSLSSFDFSSDGSVVAVSAFYNKGIKLWNVSKGSSVKTLAEADEGSGVAFSSNNKTIASVLKDNNIGIWDTTTGQRLKTLEGLEAKTTVISLSFSPDGRLLASSSMDKTIAIWDVKTGKRIRILKENNIATESIIAFSPDGKTLAFTTDDNAIGLWELEDNINEWSGLSLDENGEYKIDLKTLPYKLEGLELKPIEEKQTGPDQPAHWSKYHPFHWLPAAEAGDSNAMLQIGIIYDRNNDLACALRWYDKAIKSGNAQAKKQQDILLHWLEDKDNWQTVPGPFQTAFCKAKAEFTLPDKVVAFCASN